MLTTHGDYVEDDLVRVIGHVVDARGVHVWAEWYLAHDDHACPVCAHQDMPRPVDGSVLVRRVEQIIPEDLQHTTHGPLSLADVARAVSCDGDYHGTLGFTVTWRLRAHDDRTCQVCAGPDARHRPDVDGAVIVKQSAAVIVYEVVNASGQVAAPVLA